MYSLRGNSDPDSGACRRSEELEKMVKTLYFKTHPAQKVGTRSRAVSTQGSRQPFPTPEILEFRSVSSKGVLGKGVGNNKIGLSMRQKCVRNASTMLQYVSCSIGKGGAFQNASKGASKMRQ